MAVGKGELGLCTFQPAVRDPVGLGCKALWEITIRGLFHPVNSDVFAGDAFSGSGLPLPPAPEPSSAAGKAAAAFSPFFPSF